MTDEFAVRGGCQLTRPGCIVTRRGKSLSGPSLLGPPRWLRSSALASSFCAGLSDDGCQPAGQGKREALTVCLAH